jgi:DNA-binding NarL/FixJ family response regulator
MRDARDETPRARLLVVDDHAFMRAGTKAVLSTQPGFEVIGEAEDGEEALARCRELRPDLVLMDVSMPRMDGIEATRRVKAEFPETSVLVLTAHADQDILLDAVRAGAAGYVLKDSKPTHVVEAVRAVLGGETPLDQGLTMRLLRRLADETGPPPQPPTGRKLQSTALSLPRPLTPREVEVLGYLAQGKTNRQIGQELHLSLSTVKRHLERIISKLGVSDRTQAAVKAVELGLLSEREG